MISHSMFKILWVNLYKNWLCEWIFNLYSLFHSNKWYDEWTCSHDPRIFFRPPCCSICLSYCNVLSPPFGMVSGWMVGLSPFPQEIRPYTISWAKIQIGSLCFSKRIFHYDILQKDIFCNAHVVDIHII